MTKRDASIFLDIAGRMPSGQELRSQIELAVDAQLKQIDSIRQLLADYGIALPEFSKPFFHWSMPMSQLVDTLVSNVEQLKSVNDSLLQLFDNLSTALKDAGEDKLKIQQVVDTVKTESDRIAAAVVANTPAPVAPPPAATPPVEPPPAAQSV